jgi:hypothetical protein
MSKYRYYKLIYQALSPIHIGYGASLGRLISHTRLYIPGKNLWGAVVNSFIKSSKGSDIDSLYKSAKEFVKKDLIFTHFYPYIEKVAYLPRFEERGLYYGDLDKDEFESIFISSTLLTSIETDTHRARDKTLHETEFIKNKVELDGKMHDLSFIGYLIINLEGDDELKIGVEDNSIKVCGIELFQLINSLQVGGELKYGFGRIELMEYQPSDTVFGHPINDDLKAHLTNGTHLFSHLIIEDNINFIGEIEPVVGREWGSGDKKGAGQSISKAKVCLAPGTQIKEDISIKIGDYGILKKEAKMLNEE